MTIFTALIFAVPILYVLQKIPLLRGLGVNESAPIMVLFFAVSYFFISTFWIKPYQRNLKYRKKNTGGSLELVTQLNAKTETLMNEFQMKAKKQNDAGQTVYEKYKSEGALEEERILTQARKQGLDLIEQTKKKVTTELSTARENLKTQVPQISELIASRVLGRDL